jgi:aryl-alcohol dehydrogenase-like predicted oxidoreductase
VRTVRLGDRTVSTVGCGDLSLDIAAARGVDRRDVERALTVALELGMSIVDIHTGEDDAERLAGDVIRTHRLRDTVIASTTIPLRAGRDTPIERLPPAYLVARVETALRNTKLDALPLVQLPLRPGWTSSKVWLELEGTAARLIREGKVLAWGVRLEDLDDHVPDRDELAGTEPAVSGPWVSHDSRARDRDEPPPGPRELSGELRALLAVPWFVSLSVPYNLCARAAEPLIVAATAPVPIGPDAPPAPAPTPSSLILGAFDLTTPIPTLAAMPIRRTSPLAVFARQPLAGGALAGTLGPGAKLTQRDDRNALDPATLDRIALGAARLAPLVRTVPPAARSTDASRTLLERFRKHEHVGAVTIAELALRYVIDHGAIALPRLHRHTVVTDALIAAASDPLPERAISWILDDKS